ncbi:MAG TPA: tetratricopeptide repeat protein [Rhodanobacteraceae bacterium]|nr:tetratricopeptide repeat protein [Rhodanobacteraceae bacterium]
MTPEGVRRTEPPGSPEARPEYEHRQIGRKLNVLIVMVLLAAVALLGWRVLALRHGPAAVQDASTRSAASAAKAGISAIAPSPAAIASPAPAKSIAVLPFENLSADKNNDYFVAGMQDLILTKLAGIGGLKVIARTSTAKYASRPGDLRIIGRQLGVATILEGSVQKQGKQVLINVQLIDARTNGHIWAEAYPRTLDNIFGVEGEVAEKVAAALKAKLSPAEFTQMGLVPTKNQAAYDLFLRADYLANRGDAYYDTASYKAAIPLYRQALEHDPDFARAYARLSYTESVLAWFGGGGMNLKQLKAKAQAHAERALALQPNLAAAHLALGYCDYYGRSDYDAALKAFAAALALKPNDAEVLSARGYVQRRQGRFDAAIATFQQAAAYDPRNSSLAFQVGNTALMAGRAAEAERWLQRALALDPHNRLAKSFLAAAILDSSGDIPRALAAVQGDEPLLMLQRVWLLSYQRNYRAALALLDRIPDTVDNFSFITGPKSLQQAELYRLMGDAERARPLFMQSLVTIRQSLKRVHGITQAFVWQSVASAQLGLGHTTEGLNAIARAKTIIDKVSDQVYGPNLMEFNAALYVEAGHAEIGIPLLAKVLTMPGIGKTYSPAMLWLDPAWDPIRHDPRFQALLKKYASHRPHTIPTGASSTPKSAPPAIPHDE